MNIRAVLTSMLALGLAISPMTPAFAAPVDGTWAVANDEDPTSRSAGIDKIQTVVVLYGENRSFDNLYGTFPGVNGIDNAVNTAAYIQFDRDNTTLKTLPATWGGLPGFTEAQTGNLTNQPFAIDDPKGFHASAKVATRDLVHKFYQNQMQINGGKNDKFAAWSDAGGLTMGYYANASKDLPMWKVAQKYVLADNFFFGAFGGSFLNHQWLICACTPTQANAKDTNIAVLEADGITLKVKANSASSAIAGAPIFEVDGRLTPDRFAINTIQPPYQPSQNAPAADGDKRFADANTPSTLSAQTNTTIGDLLSAQNVSWAWYSGAWQDAIDNPAHVYKGPYQFQPHHQPFNYFATFAPGTAARAEHLKDGGINGDKFIADIDAGKLPAVTFYKPQGNLNEHPGYANVVDGDAHLADVIAHLEKSPQWKNMLVIVTYDENGGFWDHAAPPKADRWGPGSRIPTIIISPFAKGGTVDHSPYDTTSILRFIIKRFLGTDKAPVYPGEKLPGIAARDEALKGNGYRRPGDLTSALKLN